MKVVALIPARLESTRLSAKALKDVCGLPAIVHCYKRTLLAATVDEVYICTDSDEIKNTAEAHDCKVIHTSDHINGSERIYEASKHLEDANYIINVQGDEVLVNPRHIELVTDELLKDHSIEYVLGVTEFDLYEQKSVFKAVLDRSDNMIYCSREDIPSRSINKEGKLLKVVFTVGFTKDSLEQFVKLPVCELENQEPNEFLRILYAEKKIRTVHMKNAKISLDTEADLETIRDLMQEDSFYKEYKQ